MNILLTGVTGFIGKNLSVKLLDDNHSVYALVRKNSSIKEIDTRICVLVMDESYLGINEFINSNNIEGIINLATYFVANHRHSDIDKLIDSNILFPLKILDSIRDGNVKWFLNTGTVWQNFNNSNHYCPTNLYSATKQSLDDLIKFYDAVTDCKFTTLKVCDTFGHNDTRKKLVDVLFSLSKSDLSKLDMTPGDQLLDILYIDDVINGYLKLINHLNSNDKSKIKNEYLLSSKKKIKLKDLIKIFENVLNKNLPINLGGKQYRDREVMDPWNSGNLVPGWKNSNTLENSIKIYINEKNKK